MTETYSLLRLSLGCLCVGVFARIRSPYFLISALSLLIPQSLYSGLYWREVWLPIECARLVAAGLFSAHLLTRRRPLSRDEHRSIIGFGFFAGIGMTMSAWLWRPENEFQAAVTIRQYLYLILFIVVFGWLVRHWVRPLPGSSPMIGYWCCWLLFSFLMSAGGKGGILREFAGWREGYSWAALGIAGMTGQCLIAGMLLPFNDRKPAA